MKQNSLQKINHDIHNRKSHFKTCRAKLKRDNTISKQNREDIDAYLGYLLKQNKSTMTLYIRIQHLRRLALLFNKDFRDVTKEDVTQVIEELERRNYAPKTMQKWKVVLKTYFKWLYNCPRHEYPEVVQDISTTIPKRLIRQRYNSADVVTREETQLIADQCNNLRDKAFVKMLYESGARSGELLTVTIGNVVDQDGCLWVTLFGKTGERTVPLKWCKRAVELWLEVHPHSADKEAPLWLGLRGKTKTKQLQYRQFKNLLKENSKKAGICKPINPHLFRHSRATECAENGWTEDLMRSYFGWGADSKMPSTYIHRSKKSILRKIQEENDVQPEPVSVATPMLTNEELIEQKAKELLEAREREIMQKWV